MLSKFAMMIDVPSQSSKAHEQGKPREYLLSQHIAWAYFYFDEAELKP
jgi:hypothetical protein